MHVQSSAEILELHISDLNGREIATEQNLPSGHFKMNVSQLNKGIYFVQLKMGDNRMINHKFIIE
ncbi:MAG: T9SS type A sorting domain-containing protein [Bacteroidetes bacterium]|nr:T9SS type A sorting domain-containing protein [Bacteroidota bacterium]